MQVRWGGDNNNMEGERLEKTDGRWGDVSGDMEMCGRAGGLEI